MSRKKKTELPAGMEAGSDGFVWVEVGPGRKRLVSVESLTRRVSKPVGPAVHDTDHDEERHKKLYGDKKMYAVEDLRCKEAETSWHNYHKGLLPNGTYSEGPRPFTSRAERREYCRRFGFEEK